MDIVTISQEIDADGSKMSMYVATPKGAGKFPVVIVFQEAFGVNDHIKDVANRFAREGYLAVAPEMYYRFARNFTAGYTEINKIRPLMGKMYDAQTFADIRMAISFAKSLDKARADRVGCTGYCMGGTLAWFAACLNRDIKAAAPYYSGGIITRQFAAMRPTSPHTYAELLTAPVLGCFGERDQNPTPADVKEVDELLTQLGKVHDFKIYPDAGHGFFCDERPTYHKPSAEDAWKRTLGWFERYLQT